jgi:hypothetical protein
MLLKLNNIITTTRTWFDLKLPGWIGFLNIPYYNKSLKNIHKIIGIII